VTRHGVEKNGMFSLELTVCLEHTQQHTYVCVCVRVCVCKIKNKSFYMTFVTFVKKKKNPI